MKKVEFLNRLRQALTDQIPEEDVADVLVYYEEYFSDAGPQREEEVLSSLGTPESVAEKLLRERRTLEGGEASPRRKGPLRILIPVLALACCAVIALSLWQPWREPPVVTDPPDSGNVTASAPTNPESTTIAATEEDTRTESVSLSGSGTGEAYQELEAFDRIDLDLSMGSVMIREGSGYSISVSYRGSDKNGEHYEVLYELNGSSLSIWCRPKMLQVNADEVSADVVITIPRDGEIETAKLKVAMGMVDWRGGNIRSLTCEVAMGMVDIDCSLTGDAYLDVAMGSLSLAVSQPADHFSYSVEADMGSIRIDGEKQQGAEAKGGQGSQKLVLSNAMGDVSVRFGA